MSRPSTDFLRWCKRLRRAARASIAKNRAAAYERAESRRRAERARERLARLARRAS